MRIVLLGAPGSGKGTQAHFISSRYNIPIVSTGDMLRSAVEAGTELGLQAKSVINSGALVTDNLVIALVEDYIDRKYKNEGIIFDGFPRNIHQAHAIKKIGLKIDYVIEFEIPREEAINRIIGRRVHPESGRVYHIQFNPPRVENIDDYTGELLITREDDKQEIAYKRMVEYSETTYPLVSYYDKESKTSDLTYHRINGMQPMNKITDQIIALLG